MYNQKREVEKQRIFETSMGWVLLVLLVRSKTNVNERLSVQSIHKLLFEEVDQVEKSKGIKLDPLTWYFGSHNIDSSLRWLERRSALRGSNNQNPDLLHYSVNKRIAVRLIARRAPGIAVAINKPVEEIFRMLDELEDSAILDS
ncbi:MAG: hypothetical protein UV20_C0037G0010 [Candidatus Magasanikbacteria bacterium GW2011_GWA2_42_32]|uniref:Uncharacterized protein n=1 Tax=Candidatus Magasanikbacteria bacterium GW2011_GWA2_42_32 TaxID=1619039 RepID=A0A0G1C6F3_9BACT|nr:MAG: hypothetical protein UV20_C0037G0010 [Candidatus Magasanikbacteria bacterium GW2011_GWA2_42_32]OHB20467.1 MAG: hypothetical protein A2666_01150 [Parcubacteria group bacterium RIFCSPHIGHO2_01_FULL_47_10b]